MAGRGRTISKLPPKLVFPSPIEAVVVCPRQGAASTARSTSDGQDPRRGRPSYCRLRLAFTAPVAGPPHHIWESIAVVAGPRRSLRRHSLPSPPPSPRLATPRASPRLATSHHASARLATPHLSGRACMAPCDRIRMIRGGILAYSASYARGCASLDAVVAWCGARALRPRKRTKHALSTPGG